MKAQTRISGAIGFAAAAVVLAISGCGNSGMGAAPTTTTEQPASAQATAPSTGPSAPAPGTSPAAAPAEILIKGFKYQGTDSVNPGTEITVSNEDIEAHTITADDGKAFDANIQVGTATFIAPTEPGTYPYHCIFHGNMRGTLTVK